VSRLSFAHDFDERAKPRRKHLLAMRWLRGSLERRSTGDPAEPGPDMAVIACRLTRELEELIAADDQK